MKNVAQRTDCGIDVRSYATVTDHGKRVLLTVNFARLDLQSYLRKMNN